MKTLLRIISEKKAHSNLKREILPSRMHAYTTTALLSTGELTTEVCLQINGKWHVESASRGCTTGINEVPEHNKNDKQFSQIINRLSPSVSQQEFDKAIEIVGSSISAPASLAFWKATHETREAHSPRIICNIVNSGKHAGREGICEFMIIPQENTARENVELGSQVYLRLAEALAMHGQNTYVTGREGGYVTSLSDWSILYLINAAIKDLPCALAVDVAANNFCTKKGSGFSYNVQGFEMTSKELLQFYLEMLAAFPKLIYLEDPFHEEDIESWKALMMMQGHRIMVVADDLTVTDAGRMRRLRGCFNAVILKVNQTGTVTKFLEAVSEAQTQGVTKIVSQRSGETDGSTIVDLAVACKSEFLKAGAPARERIVKYNHLLRLERGIL